MKSKWILFLAVILLVAAACHKQETTTTDTATTDTSATAPAMTDTSTTTSTTGTAASTLSAADNDFVMKVAQGGMTEVNAGQAAATKATANDVKDFANRMVADHGKANDELKALAASKGLALPAELDADHKKKLDDLSAKSGKAFDKAYMDAMVKDHETTVADFQKESTSAQDPDLKSWVTRTLPTLQDHLKMAKQVAAKTK